MRSLTLNIEVDSETANMYAQSSAEDKNKLGVLWGLLLQEYQANALSLSELMDKIGSNARRRGLTSEALESILRAEA